MKYFFSAVAILFFCVSAAAQTMTGVASYYHDKFVGRKTATGEIFSNKAMTCACNKLPLGTTILVTNKSNGKQVTVVVNDRLAANNHRLVDLTKQAAKELGFVASGTCKVEIEVLSSAKIKKQKIRKKKKKLVNKETAVEPETAE